MRMIDAPRATAIQIRDPRAALASGELQTDDVLALEEFDRAFCFSPDVVERARLRYEADTGRGSVHVSKSTPFVFSYLLYEAFIGGRADGLLINFFIVGEGEFAVRFDDQNLAISNGKADGADATVVMSRITFGGLILFKVRSASADASAQKAALTNAVGHELNDRQLALVAGGKGSDTSCITDYGCGGDILVCGGDTTGCGGEILVVGGGCPSDYCAGDACYSDNCGADACAGDACYSDTGPIGVCTADGCGAAACVGDACAAAVCPGDACGEAACFQDLCGADACGADFCGADACGAAACGADLCPVDACLVDACLGNILPIPGPI